MRSNHLRIFPVLALFAAALLAAACSPAPGADVPPTATSTPGAALIAPAQIDSIEIMMLASFPLQVHVRVRGVIGDGCTELHEIKQTRVGNTFRIDITTIRSGEAVCTMIAQLLDKTIPLDVAGLRAGTYTVDVNGVQDSFTLTVDNILGSPH